jgi:hypothetical protein
MVWVHCNRLFGRLHRELRNHESVKAKLSSTFILQVSDNKNASLDLHLGTLLLPGSLLDRNTRTQVIGA